MFGWLFKRDRTSGVNFTPPVETRSSGSGYTSELLAMREGYLSGRRGLAELTATVQGCISLWENGFAIADVTGTDLLNRRTMAMIARSLALRGESVFLIRDRGLIPASDWDLSTRFGQPKAYRVSVAEIGGGYSETVLAGEVLHLRIGVDAAMPWHGSAPLRRASLSADFLHAVEGALSEVYANAPLGSQVVPMPEQPDTDNNALGRSFRGQRGRVLLRESVTVSAAGGPAPAADWRPASLSPDLERSMSVESLEAARNGILAVYGILPALLNPATTGPLVREGQRHLAQWFLQPIGELLAEEASEKLGGKIAIDTLRPTQAFDSGGSARAFSTLIEGLSKAKEAGLDPAAVAGVFQKLDWQE